jgi:hypothetical protein
MKLLFTALASAGLLAFAGAAGAQEKKAAAKGTFTMDGKTYKVVSALAYSTTVGEQKQTVVILADKPLNAAELKAALKKNDPADFNPWPRLDLVFDEKGVLRSINIHGSEAIIKHLPAENIKDKKATATISDATVKGTAATSAKEVRETLTMHTYGFDVTFDVKLTKP